MFGSAKMRLVGALQRRAAQISYSRNSRNTKRNRSSWIVGPDEVATMVQSIAGAIPDSYSVSLSVHPFYKDYSFDYEGESRSLPWALKMVSEGWHFGKLAASAEGFFYLGANGYLRAQTDLREFEMAFLKARGLGICCFFTGSDIRSIPLMSEQEKVTGQPNIASYLPAINPVFATDSYDSVRKRLAQSADTYADVIFTAAMDQLGYLTRPTQPFRYFYPEDEIVSPGERFSGDGPLVVVHAPSSPVIKGTQLVRAAVAALKQEGFDFEYVELIGVPHARVKAELQRAHLVMNEFYAYMPGVFGVEAMASGAVMFSSADERIETDLPDGSNRAWVVTKHFEVTEKLREALSAPRAELLKQAEAGQNWVRAHATAEVSGRAIREILETVSRARAQDATAHNL